MLNILRWSTCEGRSIKPRMALVLANVMKYTKDHWNYSETQGKNKQWINRNSNNIRESKSTISPNLHFVLAGQHISQIDCQCRCHPPNLYTQRLHHHST